jgi:sugar phosphate permease
MSKTVIILIAVGVIVFITAMVIGVDALMCAPPCV